MLTAFLSSPDYPKMAVPYDLLSENKECLLLKLQSAPWESTTFYLDFLPSFSSLLSTAIRRAFLRVHPFVHHEPRNLAPVWVF